MTLVLLVLKVLLVLRVPLVLQEEQDQLVLKVIRVLEEQQVLRVLKVIKDFKVLKHISAHLPHQVELLLVTYGGKVIQEI